jgi:hypothetical protein
MYARRSVLLLVIVVVVAATAVGCGGASTATAPATPTATTTRSAAPTKATPTPDPWSGNWVSTGLPPTMYVHLGKVGSHTYRVRLLPGDGTAYKGTAILHGSRLVSKRGTFVVDSTGLFLLGARGALFKPTTVAVETMSPVKSVAPQSTPQPVVTKTSKPFTAAEVRELKLVRDQYPRYERMRLKYQAARDAYLAGDSGAADRYMQQAVDVLGSMPQSELNDRHNVGGHVARLDKDMRMFDDALYKLFTPYEQTNYDLWLAEAATASTNVYSDLSKLPR